MLKLIGSIFKYSLLVLAILVLSHIVEVKGVSVSQHVLNGMNFITGFSPSRQINQITESYSRSMKTHFEEIQKADPEINPDDQKALNQVIEQAQKKK
jgi:hypothetical protein